MPASYHSSLVERQWFFNNLLGPSTQKPAKISRIIEEEFEHVEAEDQL